MRQLTAKQKKVLTAYRKNGGQENNCDSLPLEIWQKLEAINDTEILWQEVNRWLWDNPAENKYTHIIYT